MGEFGYNPFTGQLDETKDISDLETHVAGDGSDHADVATNSAARHAEAHNAASHSDIASSGAAIDAAVSASHSNASDHTQGTDTTLGTMTQDIDMDGSYQVVGLQAPAASGEAIRQTAKITETNMEAAHDHVGGDGSDHSDANLKSTLTTKGDIYAATGSATPVRLPVGGTDDHVLTVDSGEATGMKWAAGGGHRKWSWADEPSWTGQYIVPLGTLGNITKSGSNPIITYTGSGFARDEVLTPNVKIVGGTVYVFYTGRDGTQTDETAQEIGLSTAAIADIEGGGSGYTVSGSNPILVADVVWEQAAGANGYEGVTSPAVIYDAEAPNTGTDYKWKMWYAGAASAATSAIGYAYSADGVSWTKYAGNPVIAHGDGDTLHTYPAMDVIRLGEEYFLAYRNAASGISITRSSDGISWTNMGVAIALGGGGTWDDVQLGFPHIYHNQGNLYCTYQGQSGPGDPSTRKVGLALATLKALVTGTQAMAKWIENPIIDSTCSGTGVWDGGLANEAALVQYEDIYYFFFSASTAIDNAVRQIGIAWIKP